MNNVDITKIEMERKKLLESYELDEESIKSFRKKIKSVSKEESDKLGQELYKYILSSTISKKTHDDLEKLKEIENKVLEYILNGANIEYKEDKDGHFSLLLCIRRGYISLAYMLLRAGANVNQVNNFLTTPSMSAARHGHKDLLELLILMGADINARCLDGDNALISAKRHDQIECFNILKNAHAYLNNRNLINQTILDIKSKKDFDVLSLSYTLKQDILKDDVTFDDVELLLNDAYSKMRSINGAIVEQVRTIKMPTIDPKLFLDK